MILLVQAGSNAIETGLVSAAVVGGAAGIAWATARRTSGEDVAHDWREVAESRLEAIKERDRVLGEIRGKYENVLEQMGQLQGEVTRLETEVAELKRYDLTAVAVMIHDYGKQTIRGLHDVYERIGQIPGVPPAPADVETHRRVGKR